MYHLARKNYLAQNLMKMQKKFTKEYDFFPKTWLLPYQYGEFQTQYLNQKKGFTKTYIVKPEASC